MKELAERKMFSIFYRMTETKIPDNIRVIIFKPSKKNQWAIIKGQLGQYKLKLYSTIKLLGEYQDKAVRESQIERQNTQTNTEPLNLYGIKTILQYNVDTNKFLGFYKTHFVYEQTPQGPSGTTKNRSNPQSGACSLLRSKGRGGAIWIKKLKDIPFLSCNSEKPEGEEISYKKDTWPKSLLSDKSDHPGENAIAHLKGTGTKTELQAKPEKDLYKLFIGYLISSQHNVNSNSSHRRASEPKKTQRTTKTSPSNLSLVSDNIAQKLGKDEKDKKIITELKKIFTGVSQGYTMNLELKGIGYSSSIRQINATQSFEKPSRLYHRPSFEGTKPKVPSPQKGNWQVSPRKHALFTSYGKFELFFSCEDRTKTALKEDNAFLVQKHIENKAGVNQEAMAEGLPEAKPTPKNNRSNYTKLTQIKAWKHLQSENAGDLQETYKKPTKRQVLDLSIGLSHTVVYTIPENHVSINCTTSNVQSNVTNTLTIFGISNAIVNQIAANIYHFKKPEPYKGKGIRYDGEKLFMKPEKKK